MRQPADEQAPHGGDVALVEVLVAALRGVEGEELRLLLRRVGRVVHLLVGRVLEGVRDLGGASEGPDADAEVYACEEGGDDGEEDVAAGG